MIKSLIRPAALLAAALLAGIAPAAAGIYYKAVSDGEVDGKRQPATVVEAWIEGENARVEFAESGNPMAPEGTYLVTRDGGRTLYLVNPKEKTYAEFDLEAMMRMVGNVMQAMGGIVKFEISDPQVETLAQGAGGEVLGIPTRHHRYRTSYGMKFKVLGMGSNNQIESIQDLWTTDSLGDAALGVWLRKDPPSLGNPELDKLVAAETEKIQGFPLKAETVTTTTGGKKGQRQSVTRTRTEVTELRRGEPIAAERFEIPAGYKETQMVVPGEGEEEEEEGGMFGGLFKKKKDG